MHCVKPPLGHRLLNRTRHASYVSKGPSIQDVGILLGTLQSSDLLTQKNIPSLILPSRPSRYSYKPKTKRTFWKKNLIYPLEEALGRSIIHILDSMSNKVIWPPKISNFMHELKSAILDIFQKLADWLDWPCPVGAALKK